MIDADRGPSRPDLSRSIRCQQETCGAVERSTWWLRARQWSLELLIGLEAAHPVQAVRKRSGQVDQGCLGWSKSPHGYHDHLWQSTAVLAVKHANDAQVAMRPFYSLIQDRAAAKGPMAAGAAAESPWTYRTAGFPVSSRLVPNGKWPTPTHTPRSSPLPPRLPTSSKVSTNGLRGYPRLGGIDYDCRKSP